MQHGSDGETRQAKHLGILGAIDNLGQARDNLQNLLNDILGTPVPASSDEKTLKASMPTLNEFLNSAEETIAGITVDFNRIRADLHEAIF
ncbi:MAG: hypothetical protein JRC86_06845 [Deltaproteobacteria bacterium]|nr:hypothetical protein [Deltaproteobacteria bacterium]